MTGFFTISSLRMTSNATLTSTPKPLAAIPNLKAKRPHSHYVLRNN